jgi:two-component sensor histidine kinase
MKIDFFVFLIISAFCFVFKSKAQEPYSNHFTISSGLPSNSVYSILEDKNGFIWFTCDEGLYRYDGVHFKSFKDPNQTSYSGSGIMQDSFGRIWYQNFDGDSYYAEKEELKAFHQASKTNYFPVKATAKNLFFMEENNMVIADLKSLKTIKKIPVSGRFPSSSVIFKDDYYFIYDSILCHITPELELKKVCVLDVKSTDSPMLFTNGEQLFFTKKTNEKNGIWAINSNQQLQIAVFPREIVVQNVRFIHKEIFIQTTTGNHIFSLSTKKIINTQFPKRNISDAIIDRKNNFWFTSPIEGMFLAPDLKTSQLTFADLSPLRIMPIENDLLISTKKERITRFSPELNKFTDVYQGKNNAEAYYVYYSTKKDELAFVLSDGFSYFGSLKSRQTSKAKMAIKQIVSIDDKYSAFVASGFIGFYDSKFTRSLNSPFDKHIQQLVKRVENGHTFYQVPLNNGNTRGKAIEFDSVQKRIYFASNIGLHVWQNGVLKELKLNNKSLILRDLFQWNKRFYGFGSNGKLIDLTQLEKGGNTRLSALAQNQNIKQVIAYSDRILIRTNNQLLIYEKTKEANTQLLAKFDISTIECNDFAILKNTVWIVTNNGLIKWDISKAKPTHKTGLFQITRFAVNDETNLKSDANLSYKQNNLSIDFALLDYGIKTIDAIYYQINEQSWVLIDPNIRSLSFPSLSSGKYVIRFKGIVKGKPIILETIQFRIKPPFWSTTWFILLMFVGIVLLSGAYYVYQIRTIRTRNALINEKLVLESNLTKSLLSSIKSQMNPHFIFNALNTIQAYIFMNDKENATGYLSKFSKLTRAILEMSEKEEVILSEELNALKLYLELEKMRFQDGFTYEIKTDDLNVDNIKIPSMLIQPYVENAVKHGLLHSPGNKKIQLRIHQIQHKLLVEIDDNGIGRKRAAEIRLQRDKYHEGFSTQANEKRLRLLSHETAVVVEYIDKYDENGQAIGTVVKLTIQLKK